jgi:hypothetical protein
VQLLCHRRIKRDSSWDYGTVKRIIIAEGSDIVLGGSGVFTQLERLQQPSSHVSELLNRQRCTLRGTSATVQEQRVADQAKGAIVGLASGPCGLDASHFTRPPGRKG